MERWTSDTGQTLYVHPWMACIGPCPVHNPSQHPLARAPRYWRGDRGIMERICDHGVGHPDPDDERIILQEDSGVHGCCGCCRKEPDEPVVKDQEAA